MQNRLFLFGLLSVALSATEPVYDLSLLKDHNFGRGIYSFDPTLLLDLLQNSHRAPVSPRRYVHAILKTFTNVAKSTDCIATDALVEILKSFNQQLPPFMQTREYESDIQVTLAHDAENYIRLQSYNQKLLLNEFNGNYEGFRLNPVQFLTSIAENLARAAREELEIQKLRSTLKLFLELHLSKLFWAYEDNEGCWEQVKTIAYQLALLFENNIFDDLNDLDDFYWSLIHRFGHFFEYAYKNCSFSLFDAIKQDLSHGSLLLLDLEEQDTCIEKRSECLLHIVMHAEARKRAHEVNLVHTN